MSGSPFRGGPQWCCCGDGGSSSIISDGGSSSGESSDSWEVGLDCLRCVGNMPAQVTIECNITDSGLAYDSDCSCANPTADFGTDPIKTMINSRSWTLTQDPDMPCVYECGTTIKAGFYIWESGGVTYWRRYVEMWLMGSTIGGRAKTEGVYTGDADCSLFEGTVTFYNSSGFTYDLVGTATISFGGSPKSLMSGETWKPECGSISVNPLDGDYYPSTLQAVLTPAFPLTDGGGYTYEDTFLLTRADPTGSPNVYSWTDGTNTVGLYVLGPLEGNTPGCVDSRCDCQYTAVQYYLNASNDDFWWPYGAIGHSDYPAFLGDWSMSGCTRTTESDRSFSITEA